MAAPELERRVISLAATGLEIRAAGADRAGPGTLIGYAAKFDAPSEDLGGFVEYIRAGCFDQAVAEDDIRCLVDHNPTLILGRLSAGTLRLAIDEIGLRFECDLPDTTTGRDIAVSVGRGDVSGCSFGFFVVEDRWTNSDDAVTRELLQVRLCDVGPVTFPAYHDTEVTARALTRHRAANRPATPRREALRAWLDANAGV